MFVLLFQADLTRQQKFSSPQQAGNAFSKRLAGTMHLKSCHDETG